MEMMKGLVSHPNGDLALSEVPVPKIGENVYAPRDVLLEVKYCGICGSDIHRWKADKTGVKFAPRKVVSGARRDRRNIPDPLRLAHRRLSGRHGAGPAQAPRNPSIRPGPLGRGFRPGGNEQRVPAGGDKTLRASKEAGSPGGGHRLNARPSISGLLTAIRPGGPSCSSGFRISKGSPCVCREDGGKQAQALLDISFVPFFAEKP